ncbi:MAG: type II secretion system F family protein [Firmicutes bacterium]|nr:type II secretion system F family protein [Bacillota bacterium]
MAEFVCKVADAAGRVFEQVEAAANEVEARQKLAERGLYVYAVKPRTGLLAAAVPKPRARTVRSTEFLIFNQQFNTLIKAGLPILRALDLLAERAAAPRLRPILDEVRERVRGGALLSEALAEQEIFPRVYVTSVLAGEKSGNLPGVLDQYISYQRMTTSFRRRLLAALVYPAILVVVSACILTFVTIFVIPRFAGLFAELHLELPAVTQVVIALALEFRPFVLAGFLLLAAAGFAGVLWTRTEAGGRALDRFILRLPVVGDTWLKFQTAQFARTLATLLTGGTPLVQALQTSAGAASSRLLQQMILQATGRVREGKSLHDSLRETGLMPPLALEMIEVGEATGALAPMLTSVAEFYEEEVNLRLATMVSVVEPAILVGTALVVGFILVSLYLPIFTFALGRAG